MNAKNIYVHEIFIVMGLIIVISFLGTTFFKKTRIPNAILLILIGIALNFWRSPFDVEVLRSLAPAFGSFALLLILLEAGLELDMRNFFKSIVPAILFGSVTYVAGVCCVTWTLFRFFEYSLLNSLLLGLVSVGCSPSILMPTLSGMSIDPETKVFLNLECNVTEVLGLIISLSFIALLLPTLNGEQLILKDLFYASSHKFFLVIIIAIIVPVITGMIWTRLLSYAGERPLWPILTIGVTLLLYGATEYLGGKGALNVLIFGLVLGNARIIRVFFSKFFAKIKFDGKIGDKFLSFFVGQNFAKIQHMSREFSFFVRTFFFVYLGAIVDFSQFNLNIFFVVCVLTFFPMFVRSLFALCTGNFKFLQLPQTDLLTFLTPRGLANALIVFAIIDYAQQLNLAPSAIFSLRENLITPVFGVIILSNLILTFFLIFRNEGKVDKIEHNFS